MGTTTKEQHSRPSPNALICSDCQQQAIVTLDDHSFAHQLGTERSTSYLSRCCKAKLLDYYTHRPLTQVELEQLHYYLIEGNR